MPRPIKCRKVEFFPENTYFIPLGKRKCDIEEIILKVEELEAMRLKDIEELNQEECAKKMQVSRQTFQNIIDSARKKVTIALTKGNAIHISGGNYTLGSCKFKCLNCGEIYDLNDEHNRHICPHCGSKEIICQKRNRFCHR
ncbi:DUF134 domain-containing protein [Defluviitalea phaphyphila]|uniref:DUF134 domain-containing protein n=1 Tax=Defluviitalea phaphyphila TaxID=1473580 RepID=UPI0007317962|nr:DUF134 domain-containing protein [Defluviitalea phaphyphila]